MLALVPTALMAASEPIIPSAPQLAARAWYLVDPVSSKVLSEQNADLRLPPASLTKMMTSYIAAEELERGTIDLDDEVLISVKAWRMGGSRMFVEEGSRVRVEDLLRGLVIQSGNDASVALAEHIAGSEDAFVDVMNQQAQRLGMMDTQFMNATGWPHEDHYTTARDLATLANALIRDHPDHYALYKEKRFTWNEIEQPNRNLLLWRDRSVDGIKTGHTDAAGYCLVASAERDGMRLVSVVMGSDSEEARATESQKILSWGFRYFQTVRLYDAAESIKRVRTWGGEFDTVDLGLAEDVVVTIPRGADQGLSATVDVGTVVEAPLEKGQRVGTLKVRLGDEVIVERDLVALAAIPEAGAFSSLWDSVSLMFLELSGGDPLAL